MIAEALARVGEKRVWRGLVNPWLIEELWQSAERGTWSRIGVQPNGFTCVQGIGTSPMLEPRPKRKKGGEV